MASPLLLVSYSFISKEYFKFSFPERSFTISEGHLGLLSYCISNNRFNILYCLIRIIYFNINTNQKHYTFEHLNILFIRLLILKLLIYIYIYIHINILSNNLLINY